MTREDWESHIRKPTVLASAGAEDGQAGSGAPITAVRGESPATASRPDTKLETGSYLGYEANPVPWWMALLWASFFVFGLVYLITNLIP